MHPALASIPLASTVAWIPPQSPSLNSPALSLLSCSLASLPPPALGVITTVQVSLSLDTKPSASAAAAQSVSSLFPPYHPAAAGTHSLGYIYTRSGGRREKRGKYNKQSSGRKPHTPALGSLDSNRVSSALSGESSGSSLANASHSTSACTLRRMGVFLYLFSPMPRRRPPIPQPTNPPPRRTPRHANVISPRERQTAR